VNLTKFFYGILITTVCLLAISCNEQDKIAIEKSAAAFDIKQAEASVKQSNLNFMKSFKAGDSAAVANCFTTDAQAMIANLPPVTGRDDIKTYISGQMQNGIRIFELATIKVWGDSTVLTEEGTYKCNDSIGNLLDKGKYIAIWKTEAGNWKVYRDFWCSNVPLAGIPPKKLLIKK
jgi:ketosteroid isomerase-like protein